MDLDIPSGQTTVILGGSGQGKSVLLKCIIGLLQADGGSILVENEEVIGLQEEEFKAIRRRVSYMFQMGALFDSMSVFENIAFPLREHHLCPDHEIEGKVHQSLELVQLSNVDDLFPSDLSGGMRKRVALARSIVFEPSCILYDEPTAGLDPVTADTINRLIRRLQKVLGVTSVVVTHDIQSMTRVADQVGFLFEGRMAWAGPLEEACGQNTFSPLADFIEGRCGDVSESG